MARILWRVQNKIKTFAARSKVDPEKARLLQNRYLARLTRFICRKCLSSRILTDILPLFTGVMDYAGRTVSFARISRGLVFPERSFRGSHGRSRGEARLTLIYKEVFFPRVRLKERERE